MLRLPFLALSAIILKLDFSQASSGTPLIVKGDYAQIEDHLYLVSLQAKHWRCSGSILKKNVILTAGHCTFRQNPESIKIRAGSSFADKGGEVHNVTEIHVHPKYVDNGIYVDYDVSILLLEKPFNDNEIIKPIQLVSTLVPDGTLAQVTGWGRPSQAGPSPEQLQVVGVPKVNDKLCKELYSTVDEITPRMTCYGYLEGVKHSCQEDSGGPLVVNNEQIGIFSWGFGCAVPGVYTDIFNEEIMQFIKQFL